MAASRLGNLDVSQRRAVAAAFRRWQAFGPQEKISLGFAVENIGNARRMGLTYNPVPEGTPIEEFYNSLVDSGEIKGKKYSSRSRSASKVSIPAAPNTEPLLHPTNRTFLRSLPVAERRKLAARTRLTGVSGLDLGATIRSLPWYGTGAKSVQELSPGDENFDVVRAQNWGGRRPNAYRDAYGKRKAASTSGAGGGKKPPRTPTVSAPFPDDPSWEPAGHAYRGYITPKRAREIAEKMQSTGGGGPGQGQLPIPFSADIQRGLIESSVQSRNKKLSSRAKEAAAGVSQAGKQNTSSPAYLQGRMDFPGTGPVREDTTLTFPPRNKRTQISRSSSPLGPPSPPKRPIEADQALLDRIGRARQQMRNIDDVDLRREVAWAIREMHGGNDEVKRLSILGQFDRVDGVQRAADFLDSFGDDAITELADSKPWILTQKGRVTNNARIAGYARVKRSMGKVPGVRKRARLRAAAPFRHDVSAYVYNIMRQERKLDFLTYQQRAMKNSKLHAQLGNNYTARGMAYLVEEERRIGQMQRFTKKGLSVDLPESQRRVLMGIRSQLLQGNIGYEDMVEVLDKAHRIYGDHSRIIMEQYLREGPSKLGERFHELPEPVKKHVKEAWKRIGPETRDHPISSLIGPDDPEWKNIVEGGKHRIDKMDGAFWDEYEKALKSKVAHVRTLRGDTSIEYQVAQAELDQYRKGGSPVERLSGGQRVIYYGDAIDGEKLPSDSVVRSPSKYSSRTRGSTGKSSTNPPTKGQTAARAASTAHTGKSSSVADLGDSVVTDAKESVRAAFTGGDGAINAAIHEVQESRAYRSPMGWLKQAYGRSAELFREYANQFKNTGLPGVAEKVESAIGVSAGQGRLTAYDQRRLYMALTGVDGVSSSDPKALMRMYAIIEGLDSGAEDQLQSIADRVDPAAAAKIEAISSTSERIKQYKAVLKNKLSKVNASSLKDGMESGVPTIATGKSMPRPSNIDMKRVKEAKRELSKYFNELTSKNPHIKPDARGSRLLRHVLHPNIGGMVAIENLGRADNAKRVFDMAEVMDLDALEDGFGMFDPKSGEIRPGIMNIFGATSDDIAELRAQGITHVGFGLRPGSPLAMVPQQVKRLITSGNKISQRVWNQLDFIYEATADEIKPFQLLRAKKAISIDIETTFQRLHSDISKSMLATGFDELQDAVDPIDNAVKEVKLGFITTDQRRLANEAINRDLSNAVRRVTDPRSRGGWSSFIALERRMAESAEIDDITQFSIRPAVRELDRGIFAWKEDLLSKKGHFFSADGTLFMKGGRVADSIDAFVDTIDEFGIEIGKYLKVTDGGDVGLQGAVVMGLNHRKFDLPLLQSRAWQLAQLERARMQMLEEIETKGLAKRAEELQATRDRIKRGASTKKIEDVERELAPIQKKLDFVRGRTKEQMTRSINVLLSFSGEWDEESKTFLRVEGPMLNAFKRWTDGRIKGIAPPLASIVRSGGTADITQLARIFLSDNESGITDEIIRQRIDAFVYGTKKGQKLGIGSYDQFVGHATNTFGDKGASLPTRMGRIREHVQRSDIQDVIRRSGGTALEAEAKALMKAAMGTQDEFNAALKGLDAPTASAWQTILNLAKDTWSQEQVAKFNQTVDTAPSAQESLMFRRSRIFAALLGGKEVQVRNSKGETVTRKLRDLPLHVADPDAYKTFLIEPEIYETIHDQLTSGTKKVRARIRTIEQDLSAETLRYLKSIMHVTVADSISGKLKGAAGIALSTLPVSFLGIGERLDQLGFERIISSTTGFSSEATRQLVSSFGENVEDLIGSTSRALTEIFPADSWVLDAAKTTKAAKGILGGTVALGAGTLLYLAGTNQKRRNRADDTWKYGKSDTLGELEAMRRASQDHLIGNMTLQSSQKRNYSYNMRPDRHDHLFPGMKN